MEKKEIIKYESEDNRINIEFPIDGETVWLTQKQIAELFGKGVPNINEHIKNVFLEGELIEDSVIRNFRITASDGKKYNINHYNLDVVISVGYRVKSKRGTQFRQWATKVLRNYIVNATEKRLTVVEHRVNRIEAETKAAFKSLFADENTTLL